MFPAGNLTQIMFRSLLHLSNILFILLMTLFRTPFNHLLTHFSSPLDPEFLDGRDQGALIINIPLGIYTMPTKKNLWWMNERMHKFVIPFHGGPFS